MDKKLLDQINRMSKRVLKGQIDSQKKKEKPNLEYLEALGKALEKK